MNIIIGNIKFINRLYNQSLENRKNIINICNNSLGSTFFSLSDYKNIVAILQILFYEKTTDIELKFYILGCIFNFGLIKQLNFFR